jgi:hypothetical protein
MPDEGVVRLFVDIPRRSPTEYGECRRWSDTQPAEARPMTMPELRERKLADLSDIQVRYFLAESKTKPYLEILIIHYSGTYPVGSAGNDDACYMYALAKAGIAAFEPWGVVHDLSELSYEWGDMLDMVLGVGPDHRSSPVAVVVGPGCEEAVRTLLLGINSPEPIDKVGNVFRDLPTAWEYVANQIT